MHTIPDDPPLPPCRHRGARLGAETVECRSTRILHAAPGVAQLDTCRRCPYADLPNLPAPQVPPINDVPCKFRGPRVRTDVCDLCSLRGQPLPVLYCALHGECTLHRMHSQVRSCAACEDRTTAWNRNTDIAPLPLRGDAPWAGCTARKPWEYSVTAMIPVCEPGDWLDCVIDLLRVQTVRPYIVLVDTGSPRDALFKLWDRFADAADVEIHAVRAHGYRSSSEPVSSAIDVAMAVCQTEWMFLTHDDVFPRRRDLLEFLLWCAGQASARSEEAGPCGSLSGKPVGIQNPKSKIQNPVVGWQMSDRSHVTDQWRGMVSHTCTLLHLPSLAGMSWSLRRAHEQFGLPRTHASWPDTETGFNLLLREHGIRPLLLGEERNYQRQITRWWDHCRSYTGSRMYHSEHHALAAAWMEDAVAQGRARLREWAMEETTETQWISQRES